MMKKICIFTLIGNYNYGNRLQNLALQEYLKKKGADVVTYVNVEAGQLIKQFLKNLYARCYGKYNFPKKVNANLLLREYVFDTFNRRYIHMGCPEKLNDYICIVGSDQVWAPGIISNDKGLLLKGIKCYKKYAYAASFGERNIPDKMQEVYRECLEDFDGISVREDSGLQIVEKLGFSFGQKVVDPTLLLSPEEWDQYAVPVPEMEDREYIVLYFLSPIDSEFILRVKYFAEELGADVVNLMEDSSKYWYTKTPGEFLSIIRNSVCVLTDSFHGTIFSYIYRRSFFVYDRNSEVNMNSRLESLLNMLGLQGRWNLECKVQNLGMEWNTENKLPELKQKSEDYLWWCLNG